MKTFKPGTVVVFDPSNFNSKFWDNLSEKDRKKYYGHLGYGQKKLKHFIFLCDVKNADEHCVLINMDNQKVEPMHHTSQFREVTEEEF